MPNLSSPYSSAYDMKKADEIWAVLLENQPNSDTPLPERALCDAIFGNSPFLASTAALRPGYALEVLSGAIDGTLQQLMAEMTATRPQGESTADLMAFLRERKARLSLLVATADIADWWPLAKVTDALSRFADAALQISIAHLMHACMTRGDLAWPTGKPEAVSPTLPQRAGYFVLGMGKLGGYELNYSSDIDLIVLYDPEVAKYTGSKSVSDCFVKLTRDLVQIMDQRTMHGYVFRTDLYLRPDPSATPLAISVQAAESYYHSMALNWERSAMIKARVVAGDQSVGATFLQHMASWVWRKNMDFAALADIAAIKNQINRHYKQKPEIAPGYNVKLGYGGIREIEFFAQINQLLHAGRHPELRISQTVPTLQALNESGFVSDEDTAKLIAAYGFLRMLEHRLQMIDDAQTHSLPTEPEQLQRVAIFAGFKSPESLLQTLREHSTQVCKLYDQLMPDQAQKGAEVGFREQDLPETLAKLEYAEGARAASIIDGWRRGRYRALRTERAKELLDKCLPKLLEAFAGTPDPDSALARFDTFLSRLPGGVQLFSLLHSNPSLFRLLGRVMGLAPALAETLAKKPQLWDMVLEPHFFEPVEDRAYLETELGQLLDSVTDYQDALDITRKYVAEQKFRTGVHLLEAALPPSETGAALSRVADIVLCTLIPLVCAEFARRHGEFPEGGIAVLAMGKYGGGELTHTSDLDIVFLYHTENMDALSDGEKPLPPSLYFSRLGQNIITAITALTPEGTLFEVDTRLRPSGSQGPLVVTLKTFEDYYKSAAWTWEHMALTRARVILAPPNMVEKLVQSVQSVLTLERDSNSLLAAVADMREKLFTQFGTHNPWSIKHGRGGLVDMEFICQYLMLREGKNTPSLFHPSMTEAFKRLGEHGFLSKEETACLLSSYDMQRCVQAILRLCLGASPQSGVQIPEGLRKILVNATGFTSFTSLEKGLKEKQQDTYNIYQKLIEGPAKSMITDQKLGETSER